MAMTVDGSLGGPSSVDRHCPEEATERFSPGLPWIKRGRPPRFIHSRTAKLGRIGDQVNRAIGFLVLVTRTGPARKDSRLYGLLYKLGLFDNDPRHAITAPRLDRLPWGGRPVDAPEPERPPDVAASDGMWPQAPVTYDDFYPAIIHLTDRERTEHLRANMLRYLGQIVSLTPKAAWRATTRPRVHPVDDALFARILTQTALAQYIRRTLSAEDRLAFRACLNGPDESFVRIDFSQAQPGPVRPGVRLEPTTTLLREHADGIHQACAIRVRDTVYTPCDGDAWTLAKYQVLSGVNVHQVVLIHPRLHFPNDVINALTKSLLPMNHPVAQLIVPHTRISLGLDHAVMNHRRSALLNSPQEIYTANALDTDGMCAAVAVGRLGVDGNDAYPAYDFWGIENDPRTPIGRYCDDWQRAFQRFTTKITSSVPNGDAAVTRWADAISQWVPGFPDGREIFQDDCLGRAVGRYLVSVTVLHSADHYSYAAIPVEYLPMRIRIPFPAEKIRTEPLQLDKLVSREDFFRHILCHRMFFKPVVVQSLDEVRYSFPNGPARQAVCEFRNEWIELDNRWHGSGFPASYQIASSIQY
jgi:hypothetical protein